LQSSQKAQRKVNLRPRRIAGGFEKSAVCQWHGKTSRASGTIEKVKGRGAAVEDMEALSEGDGRMLRKDKTSEYEMP
jgi:hypothetical protein